LQHAEESWSYQSDLLTTWCKNKDFLMAFIVEVVEGVEGVEGF
jgi:hypothetical protein